MGTTNNKIVIAKSVNGIPIFGDYFPEKGAKVLLESDTSSSTIVPEGVDVALISYSPGANVQMSNGDSFETLPSSSTFVTTNSVHNRAQMWVTPGDTLHFISQTAAFVYISYRKTDT